MKSSCALLTSTPGCWKVVWAAAGWHPSDIVAKRSANVRTNLSRRSVVVWVFLHRVDEPKIVDEHTVYLAKANMRIGGNSSESDCRIEMCCQRISKPLGSMWETWR